MHRMIAEGSDGRVIRASGRTKRVAQKNLQKKIEAMTGKPHVRLYANEGEDFVLVPESDLHKYAEVPEVPDLPPGNFDCICFENVNGKLECVCRTPSKSCSCADSARCSCNGHSSFSEKKGSKMKTATSRRRRFDEDDGGTLSRDDMIQRLSELGLDADALAECPDEALAEFCRFAAQGSGGDDADDDDDDNPPASDGRNSYRDRRRKIKVGKFSERQRSDFQKIKSYVQANAREIDTHFGAGKAAETLQFFTEQIAKGRTAKELLGRGF